MTPKEIIGEIKETLTSDLQQREEEIKSKQEISPSIIIKSLNCQICQENKALYTCPQCFLRTCSLRCVNEHKKMVKKDLF